MTNKKYVIIINKGGRAVTDRLISDIKKQVKIYSNTTETAVLVASGPDMPLFLAKAERLNPKYIVACGGDGTVRSVAQLGYTKKIIFGVIPAGTLNHFAQTAGIPNTIAAAVELIYKKHTAKPIDIGLVNNNVFLNNSSVGMYSKLVQKREQWQQKFSKPVALVMSVLWQLFNIRRMHYVVNNGAVQINGKFSLILVGNGVYKYSKGSFGRETLNGDKLSLYLFGGANVYQVARSLLHLILGKNYKHRVFTHKNLTDLTIISSKKVLSVALDGEVMQLANPLNYKIEHDALKILIPK